AAGGADLLSTNGLDPGLSGACAVLTPDGTLEALWDVPPLMLTTTRGRKQAYDIPGLVVLLAPYSGPQSHVIIEEVQAMPGQGIRSMFTIGLGMGLWLGILATLGLPHTCVRPGVWKRRLGLSGDKEQARLRAMQLFPAADLRRTPDHGRDEVLRGADVG